MSVHFFVSTGKLFAKFNINTCKVNFERKFAELLKNGDVYGNGT
ncbi:hypothetical protein TRIP_C20830 [Candidatus Zixiibacteriota bacterium]|nr:hypothetical protein TRIP_C20830 [candidate division Zixibacteria bacterium]